MLKYLTQKLKTQSINEENPNEKVESHDSGTESDGEDLETDDFNERDIELSMSSRHTTSPTDTACSSESPAFLTPQSNLLLYDQHSSEEELEVINGPLTATNLDDCLSPDMNSCNHSNSNQKNNLSENRDDDTSPKRCSSSFLEKRKRSLAHNSDDEVRHLLESQPYHHHNLLAPVNFRTSPPLEALKPHRGHIMNHNRNNLSPHQPSVQRSTTPLILVEAGRGIENIRISCDSPVNGNGGNYGTSSPSSSSLDLRSISPPAKVFAVSPRRRQPRHQIQRLQRRPCLDFDKMQLKARSVTSWSNEHNGEFSVFCW